MIAQIWRIRQKFNYEIFQNKCIFWQTYINDQRPKLRVCINGIVIVGLIDTGVDVSSLQNLGIQIGLFKRQMFNYQELEPYLKLNKARDGLTVLGQKVKEES